MRHGIHLPLFGALADPRAIVEIAVAAERAGWDGLFVWDHLLSPVGGDWEIADPWVVLAAAATVTDRIMLGPMVTPLPRRRVMKLARETLTLERLSGGRLILGLGTGRDIAREYSAFGEDGDLHRLAAVVDESTPLLTALWSGETVTHRGTHTVVDGVRAVPDAARRPRIPVWFGANRTTGGPVERAARHDGVFPHGMDAAGVARIAGAVERIRGDLDGFDIAVAARHDTGLDEWRAAGATWVIHEFWPGDGPDQVLQAIDRGRPGTAGV